MPPDSSQQLEIVEKRFQGASLSHPITAMLHALALRREEQRPLSWDFTADMHAPIPDVAQYMEIKRKTSLLPLDTIKDRIKLPAIPGAVIQLQQALEEGTSSEGLARIISADPKLATAVLSLVNSSLYSLPMKVETLSRAITIIGTRQISSLALGTRLLAMFDDADPGDLPVMTFWKHSIACAVISHDIAVACGRDEPERFLVAGLLHDLGRVMLFSRYPEVAKVALSLHHEKGLSLHKAETWLFDVDHCLIGGLFFGEWGLPSGIVQSALFHHDPDKCRNKEIPEVVYVANQIATALGMGCNRTYSHEPGQALWDNLGLDGDGLFSLMKGVDERLKALFCSLFPNSDLCGQ